MNGKVADVLLKPNIKQVYRRLHQNLLYPSGLGGRIDMGAYEFSPPEEAGLRFTPWTINCRVNGIWVKADVTLPEGFAAVDVDTEAGVTAEPLGVDSVDIEVAMNDDGVVEIVISYVRSDFCEALPDTEELEVTVIGSLTAGQSFYAVDTIKIKRKD